MTRAGRLDRRDRWAARYGEKCGQRWRTDDPHADNAHGCVEIPGHAGEHRCTCGGST